jgi:tetratricopeptide (TPR) repeat protein
MLVKDRRAASDAQPLTAENVETDLDLARIQFDEGHITQAAQTLEKLLLKQTNNPRVWLQFAQTVRWSYDFPFGTEDIAFKRAADCAGTDFAVLEMVAQYFVEQLKFSNAAEYYGRLMAEDARGRDNPVACRDYARCLTHCGRVSEAADMIEIGLERCRAIAAVSTGEELEIIRREEARLLYEAGRMDEEFEVLRSIRELASSAGPNYSRPEYLPSTPERLRRLQDIIASRDVVVFLQGPSFADFAARLSEVASIDFVIATVGAFPPVEQKLRRHLGRGADLLMQTNPQMVRSWHAELQEFIVRPSRNLLLTSHYALEILQELGADVGEFLGKHDERLLIAYPAGGPPLPSRPLHFEALSTLAFLLPLIVIGRPKRIFIVGADGGGHPKFKRPYFYYDDIDAGGSEQYLLQRPDLVSFKNRPDRLEEGNRRLRISALECDRMVLPSLRFLEYVFDVPIPPIFNVCPHSSHRAFSRIDVETAIAMLRDSRIIPKGTI